MDELSISYNMLLAENHDLQATADRRLALLREYEKHWWWCPVCQSPDVNYEKHTDNCPVKKELSDEG